MSPPIVLPEELAAPPRTALRAVVPFVVALALVAFVVSRLDLEAFVAELARVHLAAYLGATAVFLGALLVADSFATALVYRRLVAPVSFRDLLVLRGASYLPSLLNHHVGQAFITYFLSRAHGVGLARVAGATLVVYASWGGCVLGVACLAIVLGGQPLGWLVAPLGSGLLYLALLALRPAVLARTRLLGPLFEAGVRGHLVALAARLPHLGVLFVGTWLPFWYFDVRLPLSVALAYIPVLMVVATLPLTPQGVGTRDVLAALFFESYAPGPTREDRLATIAAATTTWAIALTLAEALLGLALMRVALPRLAATAPPSSAP